MPGPRPARPRLMLHRARSRQQRASPSATAVVKRPAKRRSPSGPAENSGSARSRSSQWSSAQIRTGSAQDAAGSAQDAAGFAQGSPQRPGRTSLVEAKLSSGASCAISMVASAAEGVDKGTVTMSHSRNSAGQRWCKIILRCKATSGPAKRFYGTVRPTRAAALEQFLAKYQSMIVPDCIDSLHAWVRRLDSAGASAASGSAAAGANAAAAPSDPPPQVLRSTCT